jgi:hypothetical protein
MTHFLGCPAHTWYLTSIPAHLLTRYLHFRSFPCLTKRTILEDEKTEMGCGRNQTPDDPQSSKGLASRWARRQHRQPRANGAFKPTAPDFSDRSACVLRIPRYAPTLSGILTGRFLPCWRSKDIARTWKVE